jgi:hypothetical protein
LHQFAIWVGNPYHFTTRIAQKTQILHGFATTYFIAN